jgi:hypothetical protein
MSESTFSSDVWGPHYWFFLHTIAHAYPETPNNVTKRKYYDFIQNLPIFIPVSEMGDKFSQLLDKYPISPYLDNRDSFIRWVHFIHNKYNVMLGKEEITLYEGIDRYYAQYKPKFVQIHEQIHGRKHYIYAGVILCLMLLIYVFYR